MVCCSFLCIASSSIDSTRTGHQANIIYSRVSVGHHRTRYEYVQFNGNERHRNTEAYGSIQCNRRRNYSTTSIVEKSKNVDRLDENAKILDSK